MPWIEEIQITEAEGRPAQVTAELLQKRGTVANILRAHSLNPDTMASHLDPLRAEGLSDQDTLDVTLVVATFNFVNRIALSLCVSYSADELSGYRND